MRTRTTLLETGQPRTSRPAWSAVAAIALGATLAACGGGGTPAPAVIRVGVVGPMTGDQAKQGKDMENGVRLAVDRWNSEKGGLLGKIVLAPRAPAEEPA